ncbi:MAG: putative deacylase [Gammaproteobacteria bacterium]|jgi:predicted deacylase
MSIAGHPVEVRAPDISRHRSGGLGVDFVTSIDSGAPGPHVMISAVVHGNELCGAIVMDELLGRQIQPRKGKLTLAFANPDAMQRFDPSHPTLSRFVDEDFNRVWAESVLDGPRSSSELRRARDLRPLIDDVDYLLDIHSMQYGTEPLGLCGPTEKGRTFARELGYPPHIVSDVGHATGKRMRDYAAFMDEGSHKNALLIECGEHWRAATVDVAREMAYRFLCHLGVTTASDLGVNLALQAPQKVIEVTGPVTVRTGLFRFVRAFQGLEVIEKAGTVIGHDDAEPVTTPYDDCVLIMPSRRLSRGGTAVRFGRYLP